ncbi:C1 family peptidase [Oscillochloris sp. ZM17-4]|uniref:C1 family peptidase n=1 Tax=Oscillochloris sp. ZM17-4 TaxID=2866714 RepID=UPI001C733413|nr:C1 family peptidase [Oscillochloris sp. ZM17-4]MBX0330524.1 C1 family peptidase [Oscillochloris sp. ZM17-4]
MQLDDLTPLDQIPAFTAVDREALSPYWITTAEEFIATARLRNGLSTLGTLLARTPKAMQELFDAATQASRLAAAFTIGMVRDYPTGLILDDDGDTPAVAFTLPTTPLPPGASLLSRLPPVQDQGKRNTCVAFALVAMVQCLRDEPTDLSEQFLFWRSKMHDQIPHDPSGTKPRVAAQQLVDVGVCREELWRYHAYEIGDGGVGGGAPNIGQGPPPNPEALLADAAGRRMGGYRHIDKRNVHAIRAEIAAGRPVMIGLRIATFWSHSTQATKLGRVRRLLPGEEWGGGHAMCAVGYRSDAGAPGGGYFIVRNSWGAGWASENPDGPGYAHVPYQLIADENSVALVLEASFTPRRAGSSEQTTEPAIVPLGSEGGVVGGSPDDDSLLDALIAQAAGLSTAGMSRLIVALATRLATKLGHPPTTPPIAPPVGEQEYSPSAEDSAAPSVPLVGETHEFIQYGGELIIPNGIDPTIGKARYRFDMTNARAIAAVNRWGDTASERLLHRQVAKRDEPTAGMIHGFSYDQLDRNMKDAQSNAGAGWGLVVPADEDAAILKALTPLITQRCADQGIAPPNLTFESGETCGAWLRRVGGDNAIKAPMQGSRPIPIFLYDAQAVEGASRWCARHGVTINPVDPRRGVPFYLLLVGRPGARMAGDPHIPFSFQYDLDFYWGVGRLCFTDAHGNHRYDAYTAYAERLVAIERGQTPARTRSVAYLATHHPLDPSTALSATELVGPLLHGDAGREPLANRFGFTTYDMTTKAHATRASLERLLIGADAADRPALLFSATHGIDLPLGHPDQIMQQGALLCQDWDGLDLPQRTHWLAGEDLPDATDVAGLVAVCFACFGLGCPAHDQFRFERTTPPQAIAPYPFVAQLPQRLLERGALAVLGHVDRAWSYSFRDEVQKVPGQSQAFEDLLGGILDGKRLGEATDQFNTRQGQTAMDLTDLLDNYRFAAANGSERFGLEGIGPRWAAFSDARGYSLLGDPAARLHVENRAH